jgi:hypothetical protein
MRRAELDRLRGHRGYPAVSLLAPLHRHVPGNAEDALRLRHLADAARGRLTTELGSRASGAVLEHLDAGIAAIDLLDPPEGAAVFATPTETHVLSLPFSVPERLVVDESFETRELLSALARLARFRLLVLGEKPSRLFESDGSVLVEVHEGGFPIFVEGGRGEGLASGGYAPHSSPGDERRRRFFREVDAAAARFAVSDPLPLVVAGPSRDVACFDEVTQQGDRVVGRLRGTGGATSLDALQRAAASVVAGHLADRRAIATRELVDAIGGSRAAIGIEAAWARAEEGRGRLLLVEEDFRYPARVRTGRFEAATAGAAEALDAVDVLVTMVLDAGGEVVFVEPGELGGHGPVALVLRY